MHSQACRLTLMEEWEMCSFHVHFVLFYLSQVAVRMPGPDMVGSGVHPAVSAGGIGEMIQRFRYQPPGAGPPTSEAGQPGKLN